MKGIYKFTNLINGKSYIGQSVNLEARFNSHKRNYLNPNIPTYNSNFYSALREYGFDSFQYSILCESDDFTQGDLNRLEVYYIQKYNSFLDGYNMNPGGGATGGNYFIKGEDVIAIKELLLNHPEISMVKIVEMFNLSSESIVSSINSGNSYSMIGDYNYPIRSKENINKIYQGGNNGNAILTDEEVLTIRKEFVNLTLNDLFEKYKDKMSFSGLKKVVYGVHFKHLPIYKKKEAKWYLNGTCIDYPR